jgi:two-component system LytT family response regulator
MEIQNLRQLPFPTLSIRIISLLERQYLLVPDQSKIRRVPLSDIVRLEGIKNYTLFHLINGNTILSSKTLRVYDEILEKFDFLRIHKAHVINMKHLRGYDEVQTLYAVMEDRDFISISRRKRKDFQRRIAVVK